MCVTEVTALQIVDVDDIGVTAIDRSQNVFALMPHQLGRVAAISMPMDHHPVTADLDLDFDGV